MHVNLLDRESQISPADVNSNTLERRKVLKPWGLRNDVQKILGRISINADGSTESRTGDAIALQLRVEPRELQALPLW